MLPKGSEARYRLDLWVHRAPGQLGPSAPVARPCERLYGGEGQ